MRRPLLAAAAVVAALVMRAGAVDAGQPQVDPEARITVNLPGENDVLVTDFNSTHGMLGTVETGPLGTGPGNACPATVGAGYVCGHGYASVDVTQYLAGTMPQPLPVSVITLRAESDLHIHDAPASGTFSIDSEARIDVPFGCAGPSPALSVVVVLNIRFDATPLVSGGDPGLTTFFAGFTNTPATCTTGGGLCHESHVAKCDGTRTTERIDLEPYVYIKNNAFVSGWDADIDLDATHTMTIESVDVLDDQQQPIPGARAWIADADGQPAAYFLRSDEVGVVQPIDPTPTTTPGPGAAPTASATPAPTATAVACTTIAKPKLGLGKILPPGGDDTLAFAGRLPLAATARDPDLGGLVVRLADGGGTILDATLPAGLYAKATKTGWKVDKKRTKWTWSAPAANAPSGIVKAALTTKKDAVVVAVKGVGGAFAAAAPLRFTVVFAENGECATTTFDVPPDACVVKSKGKTLVCK